MLAIALMAAAAQSPGQVAYRGVPLKLSLPLAASETRVNVTVIQGPEITLMAGADQLKQMLINLPRNAAEAVLELSVSRASLSVSFHVKSTRGPESPA
jgi:C4-dicarboxylate-specific signal transduction histidine kinase